MNKSRLVELFGAPWGKTEAGGPTKCGVAVADRTAVNWQALRGWRKNFIAPRKRRGLLEHGRHRAVLVLAELDGVLYGWVVELAAETIEYFQLGPDGGRLGRAFARANHFERFEFLPFLL